MLPRQLVERLPAFQPDHFESNSGRWANLTQQSSVGFRSNRFAIGATGETDFVFFDVATLIRKMSPQSLPTQMIGNPDCVGDNGERGIHRASRDEAGSVDHIEIIEVMGFAVRVEHAGGGIGAHTAGAVLVADSFEGYALLEVSMERNGCARVTRPFEDINPAVFKPLEGLDIVWRVGELDPSARRIGHGLGFVRVACVSRRVGSSETWLTRFDRQRSSVMQV